VSLFLVIEIEGLGVKIAERSNNNFNDKGNVRVKHLLGQFFSEVNAM